MPKAVKSIYQRLYKFFGPQHWWPGDTPFEVMVGAILTQNTSWSNVEKAINNLKRHRLLTLKKLKSLPRYRLAFLLRPSGYYNIKAARLKEFLNFLSRMQKGNINKISLNDMSSLREKLLCVKGIGPETADSILLYALDKPVFVVDAYTKRIFSRHGLIKKDAGYAEVQNFFMQNLESDVKLFNEYHALLVRLGKEYCKKNKPKCKECPLK